MAAPTIASFSSATLDDGTNLVITKPTGLADGDLMVVIVTGNQTPTFTPPASWTSIGSVSDGFSGCKTQAWRKAADATDAAASNFTFTRSATGDMSGVMLRIYGYDGTTPVNTSATGSATSGTSQTSPGVTTTVVDCLIIRHMGTDSITTTITTSGVTNLHNAGISSVNSASGYELQAAAGATGTETWTFGSSNNMTAITVAIAPGSAGGTSAPIFTSDGGGATATVHAFEGQSTATTCVASGVPTPTYSITGGADSGDFSVHSTTGVLSFAVTPDYDAPADANSDSVYVVEVTATNSGGTDVQTITVVVDPIDSTAYSAPLDDAKLFFRPLADHVAGNTQFANHGTRSEPLTLGDDYTTETDDPDWVSDGTNGNHLLLDSDFDQWMWVSCPASVLDGDFTLAVRYQPTINGVLMNIANVMWNDNVEKTIFLHHGNDNIYYGRVWDGVTFSQVQVASVTTASSSRIDTISLVWTGSTKTLELFINGTSEDTEVSTNARRTGSDPRLQLPIKPDGVIFSDHSLYRAAFWDRPLTSLENANLPTHWAWNTDAISGDGHPAVRRLLGNRFRPVEIGREGALII